MKTGQTRADAAAALLLLLSLLAGTAGAATLQSVYDAAGPGEGYDKLLVLDPHEIYTGGLTVAGVRCAIHGQGAVIDVGFGSEICARGINTVLDVDHCVIMHAENGLHYDGLDDPAALHGRVENNTFFENLNGIKAFQTSLTEMVIVNNILAGNRRYGIYVREDFEPVIGYNDVWGNPGGPYIKRCG